MNKVKKYILPYSVGIALPLVVGAISAFLTIESMDIYSIIKTPPLSPPPFIFPIIWTVLFILMGISSTTVFLNRERNSEAARQGLCAYFTSLSEEASSSTGISRRPRLTSTVTVFMSSEIL